MLAVSICFACCLHPGLEVYHPPLDGSYAAEESSGISLSLYELTTLLYTFLDYFILYCGKFVQSCIFGVFNG